MIKISTILPKEITDKYNVVRNSFVIKEKGDISNEFETEIGDVLQDDFKPQLKLKRWSNECNFSVRLIDDEPDKPQIKTEGKKIKFIKKKIEAHFYQDGENYEFEVILNEKPKTNKVKMSVQTKGLAFYYQPPLNEEQQSPEIVRSTPTDCYDKDDNVICHRPENVVGSYAVYHESKAGDYSKMGKKNYRAGKAFHIYRPKIIDNVGKEVWGKLNITDNLLTVEIPQEFLDNAVYPVRHAAGLTFGCNPASPGGSWKDHSNNTVGLLKAMPTDGDGNVSEMSVYAKAGTGNSWNAKAGIWDYSAKTLITNGVGGITANIDSTTAAWYDMTYSTQPAVVNNTNYYLGAIRGNVGTPEDALIAYDTGSSGDGGYESNNYAVPESLGYIGLSSYKFSIYCTYTAGGATGPANLKSVNAIAKASVKSINGVAIASVKTLNGIA